uniref:Uncharacterized protein n=1 Tax=Amphimedon queenslandica TaxID=400682 RepID=A0A1X7SGA2_AMPQE
LYACRIDLHVYSALDNSTGSWVWKAVKAVKDILSRVEKLRQLIDELHSAYYSGFNSL